MPSTSTYLRARSVRHIRLFLMGPRVALTKEDRTALRAHLRDCELSDLRSDRLLARLLRSKIVLAVSIAARDAGGFATGGCRLIYRVDGGNLVSGRLVHHQGGSEQGDEIGVASILGATLIGLRKGQRVALVTGGDVELVDIPPFRRLSPEVADKSPGAAAAAERIARLRSK